MYTKDTFYFLSFMSSCYVLLTVVFRGNIMFHDAKDNKEELLQQYTVKN